MGGHMTIPIIVMAVASVVMGAWDLLKRPARDVLLGAGLIEAGLLVGLLWQLALPAGLAIGVAVGGALGGWQLHHAFEDRLATRERMLLDAPDEASRMLVLHDRLDAVSPPGRRLQRAGASIAVALVLLAGVGLIVAGLAYDAWQILMSGAGMVFLPLTQIARGLVESEERAVLEERLRRSEAPTAGLLP